MDKTLKRNIIMTLYPALVKSSAATKETCPLQPQRRSGANLYPRYRTHLPARTSKAYKDAIAPVQTKITTQKSHQIPQANIRLKDQILVREPACSPVVYR